MSDSTLLPLEVRLLAGTVLALFLSWVLHLIRRQRLGLRESLLWLLSTVLALVFVVFPSWLKALATGLGVQVPANALFAMAFVYVLLNLLSLTIGISRNSVQIRRILQECAILRADLAQLRAHASTDVKREEDRARVQD